MSHGLPRPSSPLPAARAAVGCGCLDFGVSFDWELELAAANFFSAKGMWDQSLKLFSTSFIFPLIYAYSAMSCFSFLLSHKIEDLDSCSTKWQTGD